MFPRLRAQGPTVLIPLAWLLVGLAHLDVVTTGPCRHSTSLTASHSFVRVRRGRMATGASVWGDICSGDSCSPRRHRRGPLLAAPGPFLTTTLWGGWLFRASASTSTGSSFWLASARRGRRKRVFAVDGGARRRAVARRTTFRQRMRWSASGRLADGSPARRTVRLGPHRASPPDAAVRRRFRPSRPVASDTTRRARPRCRRDSRRSGRQDRADGLRHRVVFGLVAEAPAIPQQPESSGSTS